MFSSTAQTAKISLPSGASRAFYEVMMEACKLQLYGPTYLILPHQQRQQEVSPSTQLMMDRRRHLPVSVGAPRAGSSPAGPLRSAPQRTPLLGNEINHLVTMVTGWHKPENQIRNITEIYIYKKKPPQDECPPVPHGNSCYLCSSLLSLGGFLLPVRSFGMI